MRRITAVSILIWAVWPLGTAWSQDARQRQAAAEAYDRGTAAYLEGSYGEAAQWFETAHEHAENHTRAATLALELSNAYADQTAAADFAKGVLANNAPKLLHVEVTCDEDCKLDVDGKLQEYLSFFTEPGIPHTLTATFETGSKTTRVQGDAGQTREVRFEAPPPPPVPPIGSGDEQQPSEPSEGTAGRPLPPLVTFIGIGVTAAVLAGTIASFVDMNAGVPAFNDKAKELDTCRRMAGADCGKVEADAKELLEDGQSREVRTDILIGVTAVAAVGTGVIALFFTDWSGSESSREESDMGLSIQPRPGGLSTTLEGRF